MRRFELSDGKSNKFWAVKRKGAVVTVNFGRIGTDGQTKEKTHASADAAATAMEKLVASKTKKGYVEVAGAADATKAKKAKKAAAPKKAKAAKKPTKDTPTRGTEGVAAEAAETAMPRKRPASSPEFDPAALRKPIAAWMKKEKPSTKYLRKPDEFVELLAKARKSLGEKVDGGESLELAVEGAIGAIYYERETLLSWWLVKEGSAFMVRAFFERWRWDAWGHTHENFDDTHFAYVKKAPHAHRALRTMVARLGQADYEAALDVAKELRKKATLPMRCVIAFAFPDEADFAAEAARALMADDEVAAKVKSWWPVFGGELLASLRDAELITAVAKSIDAHAAAEFAPEMTTNLGTMAAAPLALLLTRAKGKDRGIVARLLATLPSPDAANALAKNAGDRYCRKPLKEFASTWPRLAAPALAATSASDGKGADAARQLLASLARSATKELKAEAKRATGQVQSVLLEILAEAEPKKSMKASAVPSPLMSPPWSRGEKPALAPKVAGLETIAVDEEIRWEVGQRDHYGRPVPLKEPGIDLSCLVGWNELPGGLKARTAAMDKAVEKAVAKKKGTGFFDQLHFVSSFLHQASDEKALSLWNRTSPARLSTDASDVGYVLGRFEMAALPGLLAHIDSNANLIEMASHVGSVHLAEKMADAHHRMKKAGAFGRTWMTRFPEHAASGLLPLALSHKSAKVREAACSALRYLGEGHRETVLSWASRYGTEASLAATTILDTETLNIFPSKLKALPRWFDAAALPRPTIGGDALPLEAVGHLATMLSFSTLDAPYGGVAIAREACDAGSLARFAWGLFQQWLMAGGVGKEDWALLSLAHFGDDDVARRLAPLIRAWPGQSSHQRAVKGLDILAAIGSDIALMHLAGIANKIRYKGLQKKAKERIDEIADARGLSREELADRLVPDLDLDPDGSRELSFGSRVFRVGFDEALVPFVVEEDGARRKALPKARKTDDAALAKESTAIWKNLKKDARALAKQELWRLEHAMCAERTWDAKTFRTFLVEHPLVIHLIRRLVCGVRKKGKVARTFMVDEERRLVDASDDAVNLADDEIVTIPHRLSLKATEVKAWAGRIADYELVQPFAQLERRTFELEKSDVKDGTIVRFAGTSVATGKVLGLEKRGWTRGTPQDAGWIWDLKKPLGGDMEAVLHIGGGLLAGDMSESPPMQALEALFIRKEHTYDDAGRVSPTVLSAVSYSELIRDIELLRDEGAV